MTDLEGLPEVYGQRRIVDRSPVLVVRPNGHRWSTVLVECACGVRSRVPVDLWRRQRVGERCKACSARAARRGFLDSERVRRRLAPEVMERRRAFSRLSWEEDNFTRELCAANSDGMTLADIAKPYGYTRERIRQIEVKALGKLAAALARLKIEQERQHACTRAA